MMPSRDPLAVNARAFLASIIANRINNFGWDEHVNDLEPEMLRYLAEQSGPEFAAILRQSADMREAAL